MLCVVPTYDKWQHIMGSDCQSVTKCDRLHRIWVMRYVQPAGPAASLKFYNWLFIHGLHKMLQLSLCIFRDS